MNFSLPMRQEQGTGRKYPLNYSTAIRPCHAKHGGKVSGFGFRVAGYRLQVSGYKLQVSGYKLQVLNYRALLLTRNLKPETRNLSLVRKWNFRDGQYQQEGKQHGNRRYPEDSAQAGFHGTADSLNNFIE
jgi:hypothetical protein